MPAHLRGADPDGADDLVGIKWIAGLPREPVPRAADAPRARPAGRRARRPAGRDPRRGADHRRADGGRVRRRDRPVRARSSAQAAARALIGAGVQGRSHLAGAGSRPARRPPLGLRPPSGPGGRPRRCGRATRHREVGRRRDRPRGRRGRRRRRHRGVVRPGPPGDDVRLAGSPDALVVPVDYATYCAAEVAAGRVAVPRRPPRAVPREPRRRPVRGLPGSRAPRSARPSSPARRGRDAAGSSSATSASGWPTSCSALRSSGGPRSAVGLGTVLPA